MNEKWFNIGVIIILTSIISNGLVMLLVGFPTGGDFLGLYQPNSNYSNIKTNYSETINTTSPINDTPTSYDGSGFTPITLLTGDPFGLAPLNLLVQAVVGLELLLATLANIFPIFAIILYTIITVMLIVKTIFVAYFASIIVRLIFGGKT